ncbi:MAG: sulfurtransferase TusA family protein [Candidatus Lokiarchaeota archaeon]
MSKSLKLKCEGLVCPMPVAQTKKKLAKMEKGDILEITGDFIEASENIARYVKNHGGEILKHDLNGENYYLKIKKL